MLAAFSKAGNCCGASGKRQETGLVAGLLAPLVAPNVLFYISRSKLLLFSESPKGRPKAPAGPPKGATKPPRESLMNPLGQVSQGNTLLRWVHSPNVSKLLFFFEYIP